jgi:DEAD/DEAH box helicase domain-containing protein
MTPMRHGHDFEKEINTLMAGDDYEGQIVHVEVFPRRAARYAEPDPPLPEVLRRNLAHLGVERLYTHQTDAIQLVREKKNVVLVTETASGKSLCYNLPVLEALMRDPTARALYVFPTKALGQDQSRALHHLIDPDAPYDERRGHHSANLTDAIAVHFGNYDGDTDRDARSHIRRFAQVVFTNPDMLSLGILPNHGRYWQAFFRRLKYVVLDEVHIYRGVFGSHVANVMRRLRRVCRAAGSDPQFICCSATIANPAEHASALTGRPMEAVERSGAPHAERRFVLWNPPLFDSTTGLRRSPLTETVRLFTHLSARGCRTIVFARSKPTVEVILRFARDRMRTEPGRLETRVMSYRGGYLPSDRREIERQLARGELLGVTCTNALELGVDIGSLDAAVLNGFPGAIASVWQQAGRAGRRDAESLAVFVAASEPLDQYFMRHPEYLFRQPVERAIINPNNPYILTAHLKAASHELALRADEVSLFGDNYMELMRALLRGGALRERPAGAVWAGLDFPAGEISLRAATASRYVIREKDGSQIGLMDASTAFTYLHSGAVYLHQGESYLVQQLDLPERTAWVTRRTLPYYTRSLSVEDVRIAESIRDKAFNGFPVHFGMVDVASRVHAFKKIRQSDESVIEKVPLDLPPENLRTQAVWFMLPDALLEHAVEKGMDPMGGLHALEHASIAMLPFLAMCDRQDIGGLSHNCHPDTGRPTVFIHDGVDGGIGLAEMGYEMMDALLQRTHELISECPCKEGCPGCIQSPKCGNMNEPLDKAAAGYFLEALLRIGEFKPKEIKAVRKPPAQKNKK